MKKFIKKKHYDRMKRERDAARTIALDIRDGMEALRPVWAEGYTDDSLAAQGLGNVVSDYWTLLGVADHTAGMAKIKELLK